VEAKEHASDPSIHPSIHPGEVVRKEVVAVGTRGGDVEMEGDGADRKKRRGIGRGLDGARAEKRYKVRLVYS
jgi:hypothetical protein